MAKHSVTSMSAHRKGGPAKHGKGKLRHIHVEAAENGVSISAHHEPSGSDRELVYESPKPTLATSHEDAMNHIGGLLAEHFPQVKKGGKKESAAEEKAESAATQKEETDEGEEED